MKVFIIGAGGGVGRRLAQQLIARGDHVTGMHRHPDQKDEIAATGAAPVLGDLVRDSTERLAELLAGHDAVVFSAGAHGAGEEHTTAIDGHGVTKASAAALTAGAHRFVLVSAFPESERQGALGEGFEHYLRVKKSSEITLSRSDLDWIIVRPGHLLDTLGTGKVNAGPVSLDRDVTRDDVAHLIAALLHTPGVSRTVVEVGGGDTPIDEAVAFIAGVLDPRRR